MTQSLTQKDTPLSGQSLGYRMPARAQLQQIIERRQRELRGLQELLALLPETLSPEADAALWNILMKEPVR